MIPVPPETLGTPHDHLHRKGPTLQTFLPLPGFTASARALDRRRLGTQRVEALQVLRALLEPDHSLRDHPVVTMWAGYEEALTRYGLDVCAVWTDAGGADNCAGKLRDRLRTALGPAHPRTQAELAAADELPPWLGSASFHLSHQSALVWKDPRYYRKRFPSVPDDLPYLWPASDRPRALGSRPWGLYEN